MKYKLYLYPKAKPHAHDDDPPYVNCVPMSRKGIKEHFILVDDPAEADYFYMGQFSDTYNPDDFNPLNFKYLQQYRHKHIADIEGDWPNRPFPELLYGTIVSVNGLNQSEKHLPHKYLVRPTFSKVFLDIVRNNRREDFEPGENSFGFLGYPDPHGVRYKMYVSCRTFDIPSEIDFNNKWLGPTPPESQEAARYKERMLKHHFSLCPRGNGKDSIRFYESCYFARVPVVIGENVLFGEDYADMSFCTRIDQKSTVAQIGNKLYELISDFDNQKKLGQKAREFFDIYIRDYMNDPTAYFIKHCL